MSSGLCPRWNLCCWSRRPWRAMAGRTCLVSSNDWGAPCLHEEWIGMCLERVLDLFDENDINIYIYIYTHTYQYMHHQSSSIHPRWDSYSGPSHQVSGACSVPTFQTPGAPTAAVRQETRALTFNLMTLGGRPRPAGCIWMLQMVPSLVKNFMM